MVKEKINIALLGVRNHGATILHAIRHSRSLNLACCFDTDAEAVRDVCAAHDLVAAASYDAILNDPGIDAVALVTPNHLHAEQILQAFRHDKHVFVEKPIANTIDEAETCLRAARDSGRVLMVGHNTRRRMGFREGKRLLDDGHLGRIVAVDANLSRHVGLESGTPHWKLDPSLCTLLPMTQLGIHFVDVTECFFGQVEEVLCTGWNAAIDGGVIDSAIALLRGRTVPPTIVSSYYTTQDTYFYRVYGTDATMTIDLDSVRILSDGMERVIDCSAEGYGSFIAEMEEFGECISEGRVPETSGDVGLQALRIIEAMRRSIGDGGWVRVKEQR